MLSDKIQNYVYRCPKSKNNNKLSPHSTKKTLLEKMNQNCIDKWLRDISEYNKLELYSDIKSEFKIEPYLNLVENRPYKNALTGFRISAHSSHIETGRYKRFDKFDKNLKAYSKNPRIRTYNFPC